MPRSKECWGVGDLRIELSGLSGSLDNRWPRLRWNLSLNQTEATTRFYEWVWPLRAEVVRLARILCGDEAEADDLAQETLLKAYKSLHQFRPGSEMGAWLATILRNTRIDRLRSRKKAMRDVSLEQLGAELVEQPPAQEEWDNAGEIFNAIGDQQMIDALRRLPEEMRWTILLVDVQQMELSDAAAVLEIPVGTVKSRVHRARRMLRDSLKPLAQDLGLL